jgi:hypothetical protein
MNAILLFTLFVFHADGSITTVDNIRGFEACTTMRSVVVNTTENAIPITAPKIVVAASCVAKSGPGTQTE